MNYIIRLVTILIILSIANPYLKLTVFLLVISLFKFKKIEIITYLALYFCINSLEIKNILNSITFILRSNFEKNISSRLNSDYSTFVESIIIGSDKILDKPIQQIFKQFNLIHLLSISGGNFVIFKIWASPFKEYIKKPILDLLIFICQSIYILFIGITNAAALRAYIFCTIEFVSLQSGRPVQFGVKLVNTVLITSIIDSSLVTSKSFILSILFSIFYKLMGLKFLSTIFNNELKKITFSFLFTSFLFSLNQPDYFANLIIAILYPFIFTITFINLIILNVFTFNTLDILNYVCQFTFNFLNSLNSKGNYYLQIFIYISTLFWIFKSKRYTNVSF